MLSGRRIEVFPGTLTSWLYVVVIFGAALRVRQFLFNRSLWLDEAFLADNIASKSLPKLLAAPLDHLQSAPPLYIFLSKISIIVFGNHDWSLRLPSLLFSILILFFAAEIARKLFKNAVSAIFFVAFISISPVLLYYTVELKPYIADACATTALLWALVVRDSRHGALALAATGFVGLLVSLPFVFVAFPAAILIAYEALAGKRYGRLFFVGVSWAAAAGLHLLYLVASGVDRTRMAEWWLAKGGFPPFDSSLPEVAKWYVDSWVAFANLAFRPYVVPPLGFPNEYFGPLGIALAIGCAALVLASLLRPTALLWVALGAIATCLVAATLQVYPFSSRLIIGLIPALFLVLASGIDAFRGSGQLLGTAIGAGLAAVSLPVAAAVTIDPPAMTNVRQAMEILSQQKLKEDVIGLGRATSVIYDYYEDILHERPATVFEFGSNWETQKLDRFISRRHPKRLWILMGHLSSRLNRQMKGFHSVNRPTFAWSAPNTFLWLYENPRSSPAAENATE